MTIPKRIAIALVSAFLVALFALIGFNLYLHFGVGVEPMPDPPIIYERTDRPARA